MTAANRMITENRRKVVNEQPARLAAIVRVVAISRGVSTSCLWPKHHPSSHGAPSISIESRATTGYTLHYAFCSRH
jgi:hypothetical protein